MNGIDMMFKSMGFDPKKMIEDIEVWKKQTVQILTEIKASYLLVLEGQEKHTVQLNRIESNLQQNAIQHQKAIGMLENNHNEVMQAIKSLEELWKANHPLSQIPLVHQQPPQPQLVQTEQPPQQ